MTELRLSNEPEICLNQLNNNKESFQQVRSHRRNLKPKVSNLAKFYLTSRSKFLIRNSIETVFKKMVKIKCSSRKEIWRQLLICKKKLQVTNIGL